LGLLYDPEFPGRLQSFLREKAISAGDEIDELFSEFNKKIKEATEEKQ